MAACLGTAAALAVTLVLAELATDVAHITGFGSEEASILSATTDTSIKGLLLAGIVIGALGVLDDLTVTQASIVMALRRANPDLDGRRLSSERRSRSATITSPRRSTRSSSPTWGRRCRCS